MLKRVRLAVLPLALAGVVAATVASQANLLPLMLLDKAFKASNAEAAATPGHAAWCAASRPGYRPQWNNWRESNGRVTYCSSPYYTVPWKRGLAQ